MSKKDNHMRKLSFLGLTKSEKQNDQIQLDDEMENLVSSFKNDNKFHVVNLTNSETKLITSQEQNNEDVKKFQPNKLSKYNEHDYDLHRKKSYPHVFQPLKPQMKRAESEEMLSMPALAADGGLETAVTAEQNSPISSISETIPMAISKLTDNESIDISDIQDQDSGRCNFEFSPDLSSTSTKHVQFNKRKADQTKQFNDTDEDHNRRRQHFQRPRKFSMQEFNHNKQRKATSSSSEANGTNRKISIQPEDATLEEIDIDDLTSHRSDDPRGMTRKRFHPVGAAVINSSRKDGRNLPLKKIFDHKPHEVFVQLDELSGAGDEREWKETARWIKYEEDVEEGSDRWGKPHVASLSFHSLLNLRRCLETGVVLMDLEEKDLPGVAYRIVEQMVIEDLINEDEKPAVMRALLLKHRHVNDSGQTFPFGPRRKFSSYSSLQNINEENKKTKHETNGYGDTKVEIKEEIYASSQEDLKRNQNDSILKRIPQGAEATTVLVGAVDFLEQPTIAFVRLAEGIPISNFTEVSIPVRFIFVLLGPKEIELDYHEIGRSIATLMSNAHFHGIAYKADDRKELISAINEFLDDSIVIPPGKFEREALLPFEELKEKSEMIRSRKKKAAAKMKSKQLSSEEEKKILAAAEAASKQAPNPLEKTNKMWGGLINDVKRRYPMYKSDIKDGLNTETLAATVFMYFAALSTAITFGGLASDKTGNLIGISETLIATCLVGMVFHLLAGQPLVIIGTTGPLLLFDEALIEFCESSGFAFLTIRVYVGIWLILIALTVSALEGSVYVRLFTRFTQEIFSALITLIYIVETILKLISVYNRHPLLAVYPSALESNLTTADNSSIPKSSNPTEDAHRSNQPNTALFCTILTLGTFTLAFFLKKFRNSHFLGRNARRALGDFGVPISIALFVVLDYMIPQVYTDKLSVPEGISPSDTEKRGWVIPLGPVPIWLPFLAGIPALLVYILIFMETHISELIVDKPERGLKKGSGLHMDIVLLCFLNCVCGLLGMPWHCAATVRSVTHVSAVTIMSRNHAPGDPPHVVDVKEQRLSGFFVSLLVGLSVTMGSVLRTVPMAVLFGVFLYLGFCSMMGVQFFERLALLFMPVKYHPSVPFVRRVPTYKMHLFTIIQVLALILLWVVKSSRFSLAFPFFLIMMVPIQKRLATFYTGPEMQALDGNQNNADAETEPDFYEVSPIPA